MQDDNRISLTKEYLDDLYIKQKLTIREISEITGYSIGKIHKEINLHQLSRDKYSERSRFKMSQSLTGRPSTKKGIPLSEETKYKLSLIKKGKYKTPTEFGGHKKKRVDGYISVYVPDHPLATKDGYVMEHILVMEKAIGRYITREEIVHHKNKVRDDNRLENLELTTPSKHSALHLLERHENNTIKYYTRKILNITTGETFSSCKEAAQKYNVAPTNISRACRHNKKVKQCIWQYLD